MNAILFYVVPTFRLTGSTINAIEYFLEGWMHNPDLKLILINGNIQFRRKLMALMSDRYDLTGITNALHNIILISKYQLPSIAFDTVLVLDYMTIGETRGILRAKKIIVISEKYTDNIYYDKKLYNVEYYGEMPFHYKDHEYRMKCLFDRYKSLGRVKKGTYVNSPRNNDILIEEESIKKKYIHLPKPFIYKSKVKPKENLFEQFTDYLYYHANKWFDPHPRLFLECGFYGKSITYVNPYNLRDGSWYRYHDYLENKLYNRTLSKDDEIIRQLI